MKKVFNSSIIYKILSSITALMIIVVVIFGFLLPLSFGTEVNAASKNDLIVSKVSTVSIYVTGPGVELVESSLDKDIYTVEEYSEVRFRAVNQSRIFDGWNIEPISNGDDANLQVNGGDINSDFIKLFFTTNKRVHISLNRRDPVTSDFGNYMYNSYIISNDEDLLALQDIINTGEPSSTNLAIVPKYTNFLNIVEEYNLLPDDTQKLAWIRNNGAYEKIRYGYFSVTNNLSLFGVNFSSIGNSKDKSFNGVFCGEHDGEYSNIFATISDTKKSGTNYYGLFGYLGEEATIIKIQLTISIGITDTYSSTITDAVIYAGGLSGYNNYAILNNVIVNTNLAIEANNAEVYAGGLSGYILGGINDFNQIKINCTNMSWTIKANTSKNIYAGMVAGYGENGFIRGIDIETTGFSLVITNLQKGSPNSAIYAGSLYGYLLATKYVPFKKINIHGSRAQTIRCIIDSGDTYVSSFIGYLKVDNTLSTSDRARVIIGLVEIQNSDTVQSKFTARSLDESSMTNLYAGGLFAYIENVESNDGYGFVKAHENFNDSIKLIQIDGKDVYDYEYLFSGNFLIETLQNGISADARTINNTRYPRCGASVAGGLVGYGYIDFNGTETERSEILVCDEKSNFNVMASQSQSTSCDENYTVTEKDHCTAGLVYGIISKTEMTLANFDVFATNANITATRDIGSTCQGGVYVGGLAGFISKNDVENVSLYLNSGKLDLRSLSFDNVIFNSTANNAYCGGLTGLFEEGVLKNIEINGASLGNAGYDNGIKEIGTTVKISSIQNTKPHNSDNYCGENYVGGVIGQLHKTSSADELKYIGSTSNDDSIIMQGHEDPNSAFCGGIIGFIKNNVNFSYNNTNITQINVTNCLLENANVKGYATITNTNYGNPDIYIGGIIGAIYSHDSAKSLNITASHVFDSRIEAIGNERIEAYSSGIIGGITWKDGVSHNIKDSYISNTEIYASTEAQQLYNNKFPHSFSAGICAHVTNSGLNIMNSVVMDSIIQSKSDRFKASTFGFANDYSNSAEIVISDSYINSSLSARGYKAADTTSDTNSLVYPVAKESGNYATETFYVYNTENASSTVNINRGTEISFEFPRLNSDGTVNNDSFVDNYVNNVYSDNGEDILPGLGTKDMFWYYPILKSGRAFEVVYSETGKSTIKLKKEYEGTTSVYVDDAVIWINALGNHRDCIPTDHATTKEANKAGWFIFGQMNVSNSASTLNYNIDRLYDIHTEYIGEDGSYYYDADSGVYKNSAYPHDEVISDFYDEKVFTNETATKWYDDQGNIDYKVVREYTVYLYKGMPQLSIRFKAPKQITLNGVETIIPLYDLNYYVKDSNLDLIVDNSSNGIGIINPIYHANDLDYHDYEILYTPHINFTNFDTYDVYTFYFGLDIGISDYHEQACFQVNLVPNEMILEGITYADYTKPLNYHVAGVGTQANPYLLADDSVTKFLPVISFSNDPKKQLYSQDTYAELVSYEASGYTSGNNKYYTMLTSGELTVTAVTNTAWPIKVTLNKSKNYQTLEVYYSVVTRNKANVTSIGANPIYLPYTTENSPFYLRLDIFSGYSGNPIEYGFLISIGSTEIEDPFSESNIIIKGINEDGSVTTSAISSFNQKYIGYDIYIYNASDDITVECEFVPVYTVTFDLNLFVDIINPNYTGDLNKVYSLESGTNFTTYFTNKKTEISNFANSAILEGSGIVFSGWYLVNDASSVESYGYSLEDVLKLTSMNMSSSLTFYARWSFLVELVEAPGTLIKPSFADSFLYNYGDDPEETGVNRTIQIPINNNRGYIFTIEKEEGFIGEATVNAYIIRKIGGNEEISSIDVEKYHENMYLYFIPPESITGYLVIVTSISNSELIVGENTATVTEEIIPEDGIFTFKYIVNHRNNDDLKTYIYNSGNTDKDSNLKMNKDFLLKFKVEKYGADGTYLIDRSLSEGTLIEVYYQKLVNGIITKDVIGAYKVTNETQYVKLSDFSLANQSDETAFKNETFSNFLGNDKVISEVYYFVITPPNGLSTIKNGEVYNYVIEAGYLDATSNPLDDDPFVKGIRTDKEFANIPIETNLDFTKIESSRQQTIYSVTPSRETTLVKNEDNSYTFTDRNEYHILSIKTNDSEIKDNALILYDQTSKNTLLESDERLNYGINSLKLELGFNKGLVEIYGKVNQNDNWTLVGTVNVTNESYQEYELIFNNKNYHYFMIDNISTNEMHLRKIIIMSSDNGMLYKLDFDDVINEGNGIYSFNNKIVGDSRHDGKTFMLAIQLKDGENILENIPDGVVTVSYSINGIINNINPISPSEKGKHTVYINLSDILDNNLLSEFNFTITINGYALHAVQLLEVINAYKPSNSEVRETI